MDHSSVLVDSQAARVASTDLRQTLVKHREKLAANRDLVWGSLLAAQACLGDRTPSALLDDRPLAGEAGVSAGHRASQRHDHLPVRLQRGGGL
jgi:hypothetical protein